MLEIETLHHVSVPVSDLDRARTFYTQVPRARGNSPPRVPVQGRVVSRGRSHASPDSGGEGRAGDVPGRQRHRFARHASRDSRAKLQARGRYLLSKGYRASDERNPRPVAGRSAADASQPIGPGGLSADLHSGSRSERDRDQRRDGGLKGRSRTRPPPPPARRRTAPSLEGRRRVYALMNASRSVLIWSLLTVHMPCDSPG